MAATYAPERMKDAIAAVLPQTTNTNNPEPSSLSQHRSNTTTMKGKRSGSSSSTSSTTAAASQPTEQTPLLNPPQTPNPKSSSSSTTTRPIPSPSPLKNGNFEVEADFLQAMMVVLEREANMQRGAASSRKEEIRRIVRRELAKAETGTSSTAASSSAAAGPSTTSQPPPPAATEDEARARSAVRGVLSRLDPPPKDKQPVQTQLRLAEELRIRAIVLQELEALNRIKAQTKRVHEFLSFGTIFGVTLGAAGVVVWRRLVERRPDEVHAVLDSAGKVGAGVLGGLLAVKGLLWGLGVWNARRRERIARERGDSAV